MQVFDYVILFVPTEEQKLAGQKAEIVKEGRLLEKDMNAANIKVARAIPEEWDDRVDELKIAIRPF